MTLCLKSIGEGFFKSIVQLILNQHIVQPKCKVIHIWTCILQSSDLCWPINPVILLLGWTHLLSSCFFKHLISFRFGVCVTGNQQSLYNKSHLWTYTSHWLNADLFLLMGFPQVLAITASKQFKSFNTSILYSLSWSLRVNWISFNAIIEHYIPWIRSH